MASTCKYFEEDTVYRLNKKGHVEFGLILENSEFVSSDEEDETDKLADWEDRMKRGHVRIAWHPKGREEVLSEKRVKLLDRSLMPGDIVRKLVKGKDTQLGYCRSTDVRAAIQIVGSKIVITDVKSTDLTPLEDYSSDIAVFLGSWVGIIKVVKSEVTARTVDGSRCVLSDDDALDLDDVLDKRDRLSEFRKYNFYPGQRLWGPVHCFEKVTWLNKSKEIQILLTKSSRSLWVTVEDVKVVSLEVQWLCRAYCEGASVALDVEQPKYVVQGDDLQKIKMMHIFESCALQTGDRNYYVIKDKDQVLSLDEWKKVMSSKVGALVPAGGDVVNPVDIVKHIEKTESNSDKNSCAQITLNEDKDRLVSPFSVSHFIQNRVSSIMRSFKTDSESDFEDMEDEDDNSSDTCSVTSHSTASSVEQGKTGSRKSRKGNRSGPWLATKMLKKKKLRRARKKYTPSVTLPITPGERVVTETLVTETKAAVVWQDGSVEEEIPSAELYPIHHLDGHEFFPGDFVLENKDAPKAHEYGVVKKVDHTGRTANVTWLKTYIAGSDPKPLVIDEQEVSVYDIKDHPDFRYRPGSCVIRVANFEDNNPENTAGQVLDIHPTGKVEVFWVSGRKSFCYPQELYRIGEYDSDDLWAEDESGGESETEWETESENSVLSSENGSVEEDEKKSKIKEDSDKSCKKESEFTKSNLASMQSGLSGVTPKLPSVSADPNSNESSTPLKQNLLTKIEKLRSGMAQLDEIFVQDPTIQNTALMRKLLEIYKQCRLLDQLLGTGYFHEKHLQALVEQLRQKGRINSAQHMADQISRLFSSVRLNSGNKTEDTLKEISDACKIIENGSIAADSDNNKLEEAIDLREQGKSSSSSSNPCRQLFHLLKSRLLPAHQDLQNLFGMSAASASSAMKDASIDDSPKHIPTSVVEGATAAAQPEETLNTPSSNEVNDMVLSKEDEIEIMSTAGQGIFSVLESVPDTHKFKLSIFQPIDPRAFFKTVRKEMQLLKSSLPEGIIVKGFEDRMDLFSVLIKGSKRTPYEDGIFLFDFQLPNVYPKSPPLCHYISYCSDRLNPNLYEGGKVCVSLLGTWGGKGTEIWNPQTSNLLQVIVSIQGLILVSEPYYNEAGYERQRGTQQGRENSRMYNEMVLLKLVQSMSKMVVNPPDIFKEEITEHFKNQAHRMVKRLEKWLDISEAWNSNHPMTPTSPTVFRELHQKELSLLDSTSNYVSEDPLSLLPEYPLLPASKGFCLTLRKSLTSFKDLLASLDIAIELKVNITETKT